MPEIIDQIREANGGFATALYALNARLLVLKTGLTQEGVPLTLAQLATIKLEAKAAFAFGLEQAVAIKALLDSL